MSHERYPQNTKKSSKKKNAIKRVYYARGVIEQDMLEIGVSFDIFLHVTLTNLLYHALVVYPGPFQSISQSFKDFAREFLRKIHLMGSENAFIAWARYKRFFTEYNEILKKFCESEAIDTCMKNLNIYTLETHEKKMLLQKIQKQMETILLVGKEKRYMLNLPNLLSTSYYEIHTYLMNTYQNIDLHYREVFQGSPSSNKFKILYAVLGNFPLFIGLCFPAYNPSALISKSLLKYQYDYYMAKPKRSENLLNEEEWEEYAIAMEKNQQSLKSFKNGLQIAGSVFAAGIIYLLWTSLSSSEMSVYSISSLMFVMQKVFWPMAYKYIKSYDKQYQVPFVIKESKRAYSSMLEDVRDSIEIQEIRGETYNTSLLTLTFLGPQGKKFAKIFQHCLIVNNVRLLAREENQIIVRAFVLHHPDQKKIKNLFQKNCQAERDIAVFKKQTYKIFHNFEFYFIPSYDKDHIAVVEIIIILPIDAYKELNKLSVQAFQKTNNATLEIEKIEGSIKISIKGRSKFTPKDINILQQIIKPTYYSRNYSSSQTSTHVMTGYAYGKQLGLETAEDATEADEEATDKSTANTRVIQWNSAQYDFSSKNNRTHPIKRSHYLPAFRRFTLWGINRSEFRTDEEYTTVKNIVVRNPVIVPPKANQGLVHTKAYKQDPDTKTWIQCSLKAKAKGSAGNIRAYAMDEISNTGETLSTFKVLELDSHKGMKM